MSQVRLNTQFRTVFALFWLFSCELSRNPSIIQYLLYEAFFRISVNSQSCWMWSLKRIVLLSCWSNIRGSSVFTSQINPPTTPYHTRHSKFSSHCVRLRLNTSSLYIVFVALSENSPNIFRHQQTRNSNFPFMRKVYVWIRLSKGNKTSLEVGMF